MTESTAWYGVGMVAQVDTPEHRVNEQLAVRQNQSSRGHKRLRAFRSIKHNDDVKTHSKKTKLNSTSFCTFQRSISGQTRRKRLSPPIHPQSGAGRV